MPDLIKQPRRSAASRPTTSPRPRPSTPKRSGYIRVSDIEAVVARLSAGGVEFERYDFVDHAFNRRGGPYIAWFKDPVGNILSVLQER